MVIDGYTGWPANVNKIILENSTISVGSEKTPEGKTEAGGSRAYSAGFFAPDTYNVEMEFKWTDDENTATDGESEYTRFLKWYKYIHRYGTVPFEFPQILYSPESGIYTVDKNSHNYKVEYYRIKGPLNWKKSGEMMKVTMKWETVYFGVIDLDANNLKDSVSNNLFAKNGYLDIPFETIAITEPVSNDFKLYIDDKPEPIVGYCFLDFIARLYFAKKTKGGRITYSYTSKTLSVKKDEYTTNFIV